MFRITSWGSQLFVLRNNPSTNGNVVSVHDTNTYAQTNCIRIPGSKHIHSMALCAHNKCLYLNDSRFKNINTYDLQENKVINKWPVQKMCRVLTVSKGYNLLIVFLDENKIKEYSPAGVKIREISVDNSMDGPYQCIQLSNDVFAVCHGINGGVKTIDTQGHIIQSYVGLLDSESIGGPYEMTISNQGYIIITDCCHNKVEILSSILTHICYVEIPGFEFDYPLRVHLDELNHLLYIKEHINDRLIVIDVDTNKTKQ